MRIPINSLSTTTYNNMVYSESGSTLQAGAYGVFLLINSFVNNPIIQIKVGTGGTPTNFYATSSASLELYTGINGTGTSITSFVGSEPAYVTLWYDQTGNGYTATPQTYGGGNLPKYNVANRYVDFLYNGYFTLPDGAYPTCNLPYTYLYKQVTLLTYITSLFCGGGAPDNGFTLFTDVNGNLEYVNNLWNK